MRKIVDHHSKGFVDLNELGEQQVRLSLLFSPRRAPGTGRADHGQSPDIKLYTYEIITSEPLQMYLVRTHLCRAQDIYITNKTFHNHKTREKCVVSARARGTESRDKLSTFLGVRGA